MVFLMDTQRLKRVLLLGQSIIYLIAFASIYYQIPGKYILAIFKSSLVYKSIYDAAKPRG